MKSNRWDDHYARRARDERWLARSVYKLKEIDQKFRLLRTGDRVLDLGCTPGSWAQYCLQKVGAKGDVVGIDLTKPRHLSAPNFRFVEADVLTVDIEWLSAQMPLRDVVLSDLAPPTTGIRARDESRSLELGRRALEMARTLLKQRGRFVCKIFEGEDLETFAASLSADFRETRRFRPEATRKRSREVYFVATK
ncbi:MAG: RlmE family RNA methyltransferase [Deltaproteobacteria bacterium]|nr:RlmE family RNA methyltransferase [Deltaproteobacteria bacterium]